MYLGLLILRTKNLSIMQSWKLKKSKNSGKAPRAASHGVARGVARIFSIFKIFNFALKDFLIQLQRNSTLLNPTVGGQFLLPTLHCRSRAYILHRDYLREYLREVSWNLRGVSWNLSGVAREPEVSPGIPEVSPGTPEGWPGAPDGSPGTPEEWTGTPEGSLWTPEGWPGTPEESPGTTEGWAGTSEGSPESRKGDISDEIILSKDDSNCILFRCCFLKKSFTAKLKILKIEKILLYPSPLRGSGPLLFSTLHLKDFYP